jgi:hydrogen peroxide-dependent heme synthase
VADPTESGKRPGQGKAARDLNEQIRYTMWSVYRLVPGASAPSSDLAAVVAQAAAQDVVLRGAYDVGGLRGDADLMLWWHGPTAESLQSAYRAVAGAAGERLEPVWSQMALHRPAEFNRSHVPAFLADERAREWVCVYPFVRSYEWYLLEESERRAMLVEHGQMGREYPDVRANTVAAFALGDYEWLLAFEADELHRIVDLMRHLRASSARRHVREETPFYTGHRVEVDAADTMLRG